MRPRPCTGRGDEKGDNPALERGIAAWRRLLAERPRTRVPLAWAGTRNNLGTALKTLGEREAGTDRLEEAVAAYDRALGVFEAAKIGSYVEGTRRNRARARAELAKRRPGPG